MAIVYWEQGLGRLYLGKPVYYLIEAYARGLYDTDRFTGELTALCCCGSAFKGLSDEEIVLLDELCTGAQRFSDEDELPGRDMLSEAQFRAFFDRLYPELKCKIPYEVWKDFS